MILSGLVFVHAVNRLTGVVRVSMSSPMSYFTNKVTNVFRSWWLSLMMQVV